MAKAPAVFTSSKAERKERDRDVEATAHIRQRDVPMSFTSTRPAFEPPTEDSVARVDAVFRALAAGTAEPSRPLVERLAEAMDGAVESALRTYLYGTMPHGEIDRTIEKSKRVRNGERE